MDMTREEIEILEDNLNDLKESVRDGKKVFIAVEDDVSILLIKALSRLIAYENADLIERDKARDIICEKCTVKSKDDCPDIQICEPVKNLMNIPRFEPKGSDNND